MEDIFCYSQHLILFAQINVQNVRRNARDVQTISFLFGLANNSLFAFRIVFTCHRCGQIKLIGNIIGANLYIWTGWDIAVCFILAIVHQRSKNY